MSVSVFTKLYFRFKRIKRICAGGEDHDGPFVCMRDILGDRYYLCIRCFYTMLDEERELDEFLDKEEKEAMCHKCRHWADGACWHDKCEGYPHFEGWEVAQ